MGVSLSAQIVLTEPAAPLLPQHFGTWQMQDGATTSTDASQVDPAHGAELTEDGLRRFAAAKYLRGASVLDVQATQFVDATGASAALSLYRSTHAALKPLAAGQKLGNEAATDEGEVVFREGSTVVSAKAAHVQAGDLLPLAVTLPKISGPRGMAPLLPTLLPGKGLEAASVRYALGPAGYKATGGLLPAEIVGFDKSAEVVTASYTRPGKGMLTMLLYPTPQIAGDHGRAIEAWVNGHKEGLGTVKMRREGPLVAMTTGDFPAEEAQRMIENIHLKAEVTWEKKMPLEFHSEVRKTASLLTSIAVLSGVLMLAAVLLGLFLGVGRASLRVWMGKPAAAEAEFLGLGLTRGLSAPVSRRDDSA
jgi:hypothetical protein